MKAVAEAYATGWAGANTCDCNVNTDATVSAIGGNIAEAATEVYVAKCTSAAPLPLLLCALCVLPDPTSLLLDYFLGLNDNQNASHSVMELCRCAQHRCTKETSIGIPRYVDPPQIHLSEKEKTYVPTPTTCSGPTSETV